MLDGKDREFVERAFGRALTEDELVLVERLDDLSDAQRMIAATLFKGRSVLAAATYVSGLGREPIKLGAATGPDPAR